MTFSFLQNTANTADTTTYTFSSENLGAAASDRQIIVGITSRKAGTATTISSVTIGGISASIVRQQDNTATGSNHAGIAIANVPTGTTGDIVVTFADSMVRCMIGVYRATGIDPTAHDHDQYSSTSDPTVNLDIPAGGFALATAIDSSVTTVTWTGLTEDYDAQVESFVTYTGASDTFETQQTGLTITANYGSNTAPVAVFASWGPISGQDNSVKASIVKTNENANSVKAEIVTEEVHALWRSGFELNKLPSGTFGDNSVEFYQSGGTISLVTSPVRSGTYALRVNPSNSFGYVRTVYAGVNGISGVRGAHYFRLYVRIATIPSTTFVDLFTVKDWAGNWIADIYVHTDNTLRLYDDWNGVDVGSPSSVLNTDQWYRVEMLVDDTDASNVYLEGKINGTTFASGTVNQSSGTQGQQLIEWGVYPNNRTIDMYIDDLAINYTQVRNENTWPGEGQIIHLKPNATGDNEGWTGTGDNYTLVDEVTPDDATTTITSSTLNTIDDYNIETPTAIYDTDTINLVQVGVRFKQGSNSGSIVVRAKNEASGTVEEGTAIDTSGGTNWFTNNVDPPQNPSLTMKYLPQSTSEPWTKTDLNSTQIGVRTSVDPTGDSATVSAVWALVEYQQNILNSVKANITSVETQTQNNNVKANIVVATSQNNSVKANLVNTYFSGDLNKSVKLPGTASNDTSVGDTSWLNVDDIKDYDHGNAFSSARVSVHTVSASAENSIRLFVSGSPSGDDKSTGAGITNDELKIYGSPTDTWGLSLTPAQVNASGFGFGFSVAGNLGTSYYLYGSNYNFDVPTTATIKGVELRMYRNHFSATVYIGYAEMIVYYDDSINSTKASVVTEVSKENSTKGSIEVENQKASNTKANVLQTNEVSSNNTKANIKATTSSNNDSKASIVLETTQTNSSKTNVLVETSKENSAKVNIEVENQSPNGVIANILRTGEKQANNIKSNITTENSQNNSVKANIILSGPIEKNINVKANIVTTYYTGATYDWKLTTADDNNKNRGWQL